MRVEATLDLPSVDKFISSCNQSDRLSLDDSKFKAGRIINLLKERNVSSREKMLELLEDTVAYYSVNPEQRRSTDKRYSYNNRPCVVDRCLYRQESKACAVGRLIKDEDYSCAIENQSVVALFYHELLPNYISQLPITFLEQLQFFHDKRENWDIANNCLSETGRKVFVSLFYEISMGQFG